ncbi:hypothetical protein MHEI_16440 [Mycobacterium heidelbergense]|nr:hypothetical protein MHEI_16440 [Mycobacterium heidelbergense]
MRQRATQFFGSGLAGQLVDQRMLDGRHAATHPLTALQQHQPLPGTQRLKIQPNHPINRGIQGIKGSRDRLPIHNPAASHDPKLSKPTDKKPGPVTTETKVTQVI